MYYKVAHSYKEKPTPLYCNKGLAPVHEPIKEMPYSSIKRFVQKLNDVCRHTPSNVKNRVEGISKDGIFWTCSYSSLAKERWLDLKAITLRHVGFVFQRCQFCGIY